MERYLKFKRLGTDIYYMPLRSLKGAHPFSDTTFRMYFKKIQDNDIGGTNSMYSEITVASSKSFDAISELYQNIATSEEIILNVADSSDDIVTISALTAAGSKEFNPGWHGSSTRIMILPSDFISDDSTKTIGIDDTSSDRWVKSDGTNPMYASVVIPTGFTATHVNIYGSATSAITVYEADINSKTVTSKGTGNIGTPIDITDVNSDTTNFILIQLAQASGEEVYGGYITIEKV